MRQQLFLMVIKFSLREDIWFKGFYPQGPKGEKQKVRGGTGIGALWGDLNGGGAGLGVRVNPLSLQSPTPQGVHPPQKKLTVSQVWGLHSEIKVPAGLDSGSASLLCWQTASAH